MVVAGCWALHVGYWVFLAFDDSLQFQAVSCAVLAAAYRLLVISCEVVVAGYCLLHVGYWLLVTGCQLMCGVESMLVTV